MSMDAHDETREPCTSCGEPLPWSTPPDEAWCATCITNTHALLLAVLRRDPYCGFYWWGDVVSGCGEPIPPEEFVERLLGPSLIGSVAR